jgi:hypothetical protein
MKSMDFRQRWVLVTGASSGLGREIARQLASEHGANLVLVARRKNRLDELKQEIESQTGVSVVLITADLASIDDVDRVFQEATSGREIYGAVLNAGVTHFGGFHELAWDEFERMLSTNVRGVVRMSTQLVPYFERLDNGGGMMLVSSMAGATPVAYQAAYSSTKAFLISFGSCLYHESAGKNVSITTFVPGGIVTEMTAGESFNRLRSWLMPVDRCASEAIQAFRKRRYLHVPGATYRLGYVMSRLLPHRFVTARIAATYREALRAARRDGS